MIIFLVAALAMKILMVLYRALEQRFFKINCFLPDDILCNQPSFINFFSTSPLSSSFHFVDPLESEYHKNIDLNEGKEDKDSEFELITTRLELMLESTRFSSLLVQTELICFYQDWSSTFLLFHYSVAGDPIVLCIASSFDPPFARVDTAIPVE
ncbi:hypothetical protein Tco_0496485 [Tanacetum coccineum]